MCLMSVGNDAIFMWDFLGSTGSPPETEDVALPALGRSQQLTSTYVAPKPNTEGESNTGKSSFHLLINAFL